MSSRTSLLVRLTILSLCGVGAWISAELVREHAGPWPSLTSASASSNGLCGGDEESGCAKVARSDWSAVDLTIPLLTRGFTMRWTRIVIPVAFLGLAYFVFLGIWFAFAGPPKTWRRWGYWIPLVTVLAGAAGSVFFLSVMLFKIGSLCTWCVATHGINVAVLVATFCLWLRQDDATRPVLKMGAASRPLATFTPLAALRTVGLSLVVIVGIWAYRQARLDVRHEVAKLLPYKRFVQKMESDPAFLLREYYAGAYHQGLELTSENDSTNSFTPTVVIFSDFQCPHCACFAGRWKTDFAQHWGHPVRVVFRHLPLCRECNDTVRRNVHPDACQASYAAEAARLQGGDEAFWQMHDLLFAHSRRLGSKLYAELAAAIGLEGEQLLNDMNSEKVRQRVAADVALAAKLGVAGTPAVFLNGRRVPQLCATSPIFWEAVAKNSCWDDAVAVAPESQREAGGPPGHSTGAVRAIP